MVLFNHDLLNGKMLCFSKGSVMMFIVIFNDKPAGVILYMHPANKRWHYNVTWSLIGIGWAHNKMIPEPGVWFLGTSLAKFPSGDCYWTSLMICQHWIRTRQKAITWTNVDSDLWCQATMSWLIEAEWCLYASVNWPSLVQIMPCRLKGAKPLSEPMLEYC